VAKQIRIGAEWNGIRKSAFWIRLQDDADRPISVGFADENFVIEGFTSERGANGQVEPAYVNLVSRPGHLRRNPHFTLHGHLLHITSNSGGPIFEALMLRAPRPWEEFHPILRLTSRRFADLIDFRTVTSRDVVELLGLAIPGEVYSVAVHFDLVRGTGDTHEGGRSLGHFITWGGVTFRLAPYAVAAQEPSIVVFEG
jgi:hypothetical protein